jgi:hypothetical protein
VAFATRPVEAELWRVGRPPDPWTFPDWVYAPDGFPGRWDDPNRRYRVIYASSHRLGAFLETLAHFQPDPSIVAASEAIDETGGGGDTIRAGSVSAAWCRERVITRGVVTEGELGPFVAVGAAETLAELRHALAARLVHYELEDLDGATIRMSAPRAFTKEISSFIEQQKDQQGSPYGGIYYLSRLGDEFENCEIFEKESMNGQSPVLSVERDRIDPEDDDFRRAVRLLGLTFVE